MPQNHPAATSTHFLRFLKFGGQHKPSNRNRRRFDGRVAEVGIASSSATACVWLPGDILVDILRCLSRLQLVNAIELCCRRFSAILSATDSCFTRRPIHWIGSLQLGLSYEARIVHPIQLRHSLPALAAVVVRLNGQKLKGGLLWPINQMMRNIPPAYVRFARVRIDLTAMVIVRCECYRRLQRLNALWAGIGRVRPICNNRSECQILPNKSILDRLARFESAFYGTHLQLWFHDYKRPALLNLDQLVLLFSHPVLRRLCTIAGQVKFLGPLCWPPNAIDTTSVPVGNIEQLLNDQKKQQLNKLPKLRLLTGPLLDNNFFVHIPEGSDCLPDFGEPMYSVDEVLAWLHYQPQANKQGRGLRQTRYLCITVEYGFETSGLREKLHKAWQDSLEAKLSTFFSEQCLLPSAEKMNDIEQQQNKWRWSCCFPFIVYIESSHLYGLEPMEMLLGKNGFTGETLGKTINKVPEFMRRKDGKFIRMLDIDSRRYSLFTIYYRQILY